MLGVSRAGKPRCCRERRGRWSPESISDEGFIVLPRCQLQREPGLQDNMDLFILLFIIYLSLTLTRLECMSTTGLPFFPFKSLQNGCVYLLPERVENLHVSDEAY